MSERYIILSAPSIDQLECRVNQAQSYQSQGGVGCANFEGTLVFAQAMVKKAIPKKYYLFTWHGYESGGVVDDCLGGFETVEEAMFHEGLNEIGSILEVRNGELWIVAEYSSYPPKWERTERRLELEASNESQN